MRNGAPANPADRTQRNAPNGSAKNTPRCVVVIPAHNEGPDVARVVAAIRGEVDFTVVVVDDASTDDTGERAREAGAIVIPLAAQLGAWGATQAGLRYALKYGYDYAITMDADGQHLAESIPVLMKPITRGEADVVIGSCTRRGSALRQFAWKLMKRVSGLKLEDLTSGFRVYDRRAIRRLSAWQATLLEFQDVGVLAMLQAAHLRIVDVEVEMLPRQHGISRVFHSWTSVIYYMAYTLLLGFTKRSSDRRQR